MVTTMLYKADEAQDSRVLVRPKLFCYLFTQGIILNLVTAYQ